MAKEIWKPITKRGIKEGYYASSYGRVKSNLRKIEVIIKPKEGIRSYYRLQCNRDDRHHLNYHTSRLIWETFNGKVKEGMVIDHIDDNPLNNELVNLQGITQRKNMAKAYKKTKYLTGVSVDNRHNPKNKFRAYIRISGKQNYLGRFKSEQLAHQAYLDKEKQISNAK